jgi:hypothetical protein
MNLTRNEAAAYRVVRDYRRRVDLEEKAVILQTALRFRYLEERIAAGIRSLQKPDPLNRAPMTRFFVDIRPEIYRLTDIYARNTERSMTDLAETTARLGAETADKSARKVVNNPDQRWEKVRTAGLLSGPLFNASKEAMRKIPHAITDKITDLVTQALGMAENGLDWLMSQIGDVMGNIWSGIQRTIRTLAEQMFRRGQQEQAKKTPVRKWRRIANHETACLACLMLEGTIYDREEDFADHPNGRCTIVPVENASPDDHPGRDWFLEQDEETQRKIMGKGRWEAWQNGDIDLDDMVDVVNDPIYGPLPHIKPLKSFGLTP